MEMKNIRNVEISLSDNNIFPVNIHLYLPEDRKMAPVYSMCESDLDYSNAICEGYSFGNENCSKNDLERIVVDSIFSSFGDEINEFIKLNCIYNDSNNIIIIDSFTDFKYDGTLNIFNKKNNVEKFNDIINNYRKERYSTIIITDDESDLIVPKYDLSKLKKFGIPKNKLLIFHQPKEDNLFVPESGILVYRNSKITDNYTIDYDLKEIKESVDQKNKTVYSNK